MKYCVSCQRSFSENILFCTDCGRMLIEDEINTSEPINNKKVKCERCGKDVPANRICVECGHTLGTKYYKPSPKPELPPEVKCPKCGSTQIQAVRKNWSLLTGFLTNDVDRVCLNCKHKF